MDADMAMKAHRCGSLSLYALNAAAMLAIAMAMLPSIGSMAAISISATAIRKTVFNSFDYLLGNYFTKLSSLMRWLAPAYLSITQSVYRTSRTMLRT